MWYKVYRKFVAALAGAAAVAVSVTVDGDITLNDGAAIVAAFLAAMAVYGVENSYDV